MPSYAEVVENRFQSSSYSEGKKYQIFKTEPNMYFRNGEPFIINDQGKEDFGFGLLCRIRYSK